MGNPVVHFEIGCKDSEATQKFYSELFDWKIEQQGPAAMIATGGEGGIQGHVIPPTEVPGMGEFAWFTDPEGNNLGLWKSFEEAG